MHNCFIYLLFFKSPHDDILVNKQLPSLALGSECSAPDVLHADHSDPENVFFNKNNNNNNIHSYIFSNIHIYLIKIHHKKLWHGYYFVSIV